jgi:Domain of unknown function (DUF4181)
MFILIFIAWLATVLVTEKTLRRKYSIPKRTISRYKHVNTFHKWGEILIITVFIICGIEVAFNDDVYPGLRYFYPFSITFVWIFRTFMEWKFDRESKEYIISLSGLVCMAVFVPAIVYFY